MVTAAPAAGHGAGVSLARFEVEFASGKNAGLRNPRGVEAAASATATGSVSPSGPQSPREGEDVDRPAADACLAKVLSSSIAANIRAAEREEKEQQHQQHGLDRREEEGRAGEEDLGGVSTCRSDHLQVQRCATTNARAGVAAAAEAEVDRAGRQRSDSSMCGTSATHREVRREPLARRQGGFFLAEADANALGSNGNSDAFSFGGGGGGSGGDGGGCVAKPVSSKSSNDAGAIPNVSNSGNGGEANRGNLSQWPSSASNNAAAMIHDGCPNGDGGGNCYPTIPSEDIELLELAGKGRFSRTYRARWRGATVAVKTLELPPESDAAASIGSDRSVIVAEFEREVVREYFRLVVWKQGYRIFFFLGKQ